MKYALTNVTLLDGSADMTAQEGKAILIDGDKIADIVTPDNVPDNYEKIDMNGKYAMPGLINLHAHLPSSGKPSKKKTDYAKLAKLLRFGLVRAVIRELCAGQAKKALFSGVTTVRTVGGVLDFDSYIRNKIESGLAVGPRLLVSNYAISVEGGHMTGSVALPAHSPEEAAAMVKELAATKPDIIKLMITGGVLDAARPGEPGILKMPREYVKAATDAAHALGYKVAAHVEGTEGMEIALECGVDSIEHGGKPNEKTTELFKKGNSVLVATLSPALPFAYMDRAVTGLSETDVINGKALFANMVDGIRTALDNGITVGLGTDAGCPYTTHYDFWRELVYFSKYIGVSPAFALHTATKINADIAGIGDLTGTLEPGKCADILLTDKNPLDDLAALRTPAAVVTRGILFTSLKVKKFADVENALDGLMVNL